MMTCGTAWAMIPTTTSTIWPRWRPSPSPTRWRRPRLRSRNDSRSAAPTRTCCPRATRWTWGRPRRPRSPSYPSCRCRSRRRRWTRSPRRRSSRGNPSSSTCAPLIAGARPAQLARTASAGSTSCRKVHGRWATSKSATETELSRARTARGSGADKEDSAAAKTSLVPASGPTRGRCWIACRRASCRRPLTFSRPRPSVPRPSSPNWRKTPPSAPRRTEPTRCCGCWRPSWTAATSRCLLTGRRAPRRCRSRRRRRPRGGSSACSCMSSRPSRRKNRRPGGRRSPSLWMMGRRARCGPRRRLALMVERSCLLLLLLEGLRGKWSGSRPGEI
mmetsp:Transcript_24825/g.69880  ORF Transcript_24825/g.69880 Transcript_24825/m.69880 type:complete len:331 (+) Transcript_24825:396-1388(+)